MNDYDRDNCKNYDYYYDEHIYRNGKGQGKRKEIEKLGGLLALIYIIMFCFGLLVAVFFPPLGVFIMLVAERIRDSA